MKALITGINGMDGSYLAEILLEKGYEVHGTVRRQSQPRLTNVQHLIDEDAITIHMADLCDGGSLQSVIQDTKPDEIYNLAAQSFVGASFTQPEHTLDVTGVGAMRVFEAARRTGSRARIYQASSSEMMGNSIQENHLYSGDEDTPMKPCSPYGAAKLVAHNLAHIYRRSYGMFIACGILYNHEGVRRGTQFVTRKISQGVARIKVGLQPNLVLGNMTAVRDWGHSPDYCDAMWRMLQQSEPDDFVVATGKGHTVADFLRLAVTKVGGIDLEKCVINQVQERRPYDVEYLVGNADKANSVLGWRAQTTFDELVALMVKHDLQLAQEELDA